MNDTLGHLFGPVQTKSVYYYIAKFALWAIALTLLGVFVSSIWLVLHGDRSVLGYVISSAQAMSFIAVSVMGYHLSRGRGDKQTKNEILRTNNTAEVEADPVDLADAPDAPDAPAPDAPAPDAPDPE